MIVKQIYYLVSRSYRVCHLAAFLQITFHAYEVTNRGSPKYFAVICATYNCFKPQDNGSW